MREKLELLSAMVDDELDPAEHNSVTDELLHDKELISAWRSYNLIGDAMREISPNIIDSPNPRIFSSPASPQPPNAQPHQPRYVYGFALAAVIAVAVVVGIRQSGSGDDRPVVVADKPVTSTTTTAAETVAASDTVLPEVSEPPTSVVVASSVIEAPAAGTVRYEEPSRMQPDQRLNSYIVNFNEQRVNVGVSGVNPYVRIVGYASSE